jgi:hypothetical protein
MEYPNLYGIIRTRSIELTIPGYLNSTPNKGPLLVPAKRKE